MGNNILVFVCTLRCYSRSGSDGTSEQTTTATLVLSHPNLPTTSANQTVRR